MDSIFKLPVRISKITSSLFISKPSQFILPQFKKFPPSKLLKKFSTLPPIKIYYFTCVFMSYIV